MPGWTTGSEVHINRPLSRIAMQYRPEGFIADQIAPVVTVPNKSDSYYVFSLADAYRTVDDLRAPGREANIITRSVSSDTFLCKARALKQPIRYEDMANADAADILASRSSAQEFVKDKLALNMEVRVGSQVFSGSNCASYTTVASQWDTAGAGNDPIGDIDAAIDNVWLTTGIRPNSILFGQAAWQSFSRNSNIIDIVFGDSAVGKARVPDFGSVKALFNVNRVLVGGAMYNSNMENQSAALTRIYRDSVLVYYAPMAPTKDKASFMYAFNWPAVKGYNWQTRIFDRPLLDEEQVQLGYYQDEKITGSALGFLIVAVNSST